MDLPLLGAVLLTGISWGAHLWGKKEEPAAINPPCACHCECIADKSEAYSIKVWLLVFALLFSWAIFGAYWIWVFTLRPAEISVPKGKGKRGVLGSELALTLK